MGFTQISDCFKGTPQSLFYFIFYPQIFLSFPMDIPLLPQPLVEYSDNYYAYDVGAEVEEWNRGVWDAVSASCPDITAIDKESSDYQAGFVSGLNYRFQSKHKKQPRRQEVDVA